MKLILLEIKKCSIYFIGMIYVCMYLCMYVYLYIGSPENDWKDDSGRTSSGDICSLYPRSFDSTGCSLGGVYLLVAKERVYICMYVCM